MSKGSNLSNSQSRSRSEALGSKNRGLSSKVDAQGFERISEDAAEDSQANSIKDIEMGLMGDRTILVKRDFTVVEQSVRREDELGEGVKHFDVTK